MSVLTVILWVGGGLAVAALIHRAPEFLKKFRESSGDIAGVAIIAIAGAGLLAVIMANLRR
jgi:hypothetical protein